MRGLPEGRADIRLQSFKTGGIRVNKDNLDSWDKDEESSDNVLGVVLRIAAVFLWPVFVHFIIMLVLLGVGVNLFWGKAGIYMDMKLSGIKDAAIFMGDPERNIESGNLENPDMYENYFKTDGVVYTYIERKEYSLYDYDFSKIKKGTISFQNDKRRPPRKKNIDEQEEIIKTWTDYSRDFEGVITTCEDVSYFGITNSYPVYVLKLAPVTPLQAINMNIVRYGFSYLLTMYLLAFLAILVIACLISLIPLTLISLLEWILHR